MTQLRQSEPTTVDCLVIGLADGDPHAVARTITLIESQDTVGGALSARLARRTHLSHVVGITGPPGVGKSTTVTAIASAARARGVTVGVLAIDPSSPLTKGAILGDRLRMQEHSADAGVFIRSLASRGQLGGLSAAVPQAVRVLEAAGYQLILVETVGVGQSEVGVLSTADTTMVILAPGAGDEVQAIKAGVLEVADIFVINKADCDGVKQLSRHLRRISGSGSTTNTYWHRPIVTTTATTGEGIELLVDRIESHRQWLTESGTLESHQVSCVADEITSIALSVFSAQLEAIRDDGTLESLSRDVCNGVSDPHSAARLVASRILAKSEGVVEKLESAVDIAPNLRGVRDA